MDKFDLTPDPKVLIALTHTPMQPLDALCELIDNAIDSFQVGTLTGNPVNNPMVIIELPRQSDLSKNTGVIRIRDNGPGLTQDMAEKAIRAGFSGNNPYDSLGLFGMGFNISTGKLGKVTKLLTARAESDNAIEVTINLQAICAAGSYEVPFYRTTKPFDQGTVIEINEWWPEGNPNNGFVKKLVGYGMPTIKAQLGRRYATILRNKNIRILVNSESIEPFEHCVWDDSRTVNRKEHGIIPAVFRFNQVVGTQKRCGVCTAAIPVAENECPACNSTNIRTIEERVRGWVGIQRFDHETNFGIDLVRNGRTIRIDEKSAFFQFEDEFKKVVLDYPIDSNYGRIVGEVHLDHVPVDFLKQDFQRSSPEWQRAMIYLRGDSSLQPRQANADQNTSCIYKLYQGYRRVRKFGKSDMYMGYWDETEQKANRISRDIEKEYYEKFKKKQPGYYDDSEWWKLVEQADQKPVEELVECPSCLAQNLKNEDICFSCGHILIGKSCINPDCAQQLPISATSCLHCGCSQIPVIEEPWTCSVCGARNVADSKACAKCGEEMGTKNTLSLEYLIENSFKDDNLSIKGCCVQLAHGEYSDPVDVDVYITKGPIIPNLKDYQIPLITFKQEKVLIFIDKNHKLFKSYRVKPEHMLSAELAQLIQDSNRSLLKPEYYGIHSLSNIQWNIINTYWLNSEETAEAVKDSIERFFNSIRQKLPALYSQKAEDLYNDLTDDQKRRMIDNMMGRGIDISNIGVMKHSGEFLCYLDNETVVEIFKVSPEEFFDGGYWSISFKGTVDIPDGILEQFRKRVKKTYENCLDDVAGYKLYQTPEAIVTQRAKMSLEFLQSKVV